MAVKVEFNRPRTGGWGRKKKNRTRRSSAGSGSRFNSAGDKGREDMESKGKRGMNMEWN